MKSQALSGMLALALLSPQATAADGGTAPLLHFESSGNGPPLILLHSFGWSGKQWRPFIADFAKSHRVFAIDLPGHGGSAGWNTMKIFSYPDAARQVPALMDSLGIRSFKAIGASSGAITLLEIASQAPERIETMIVIGSTTHIPDKTRAWVRENACKEDSPEEIEKMRDFSQAVSRRFAPSAGSSAPRRTSPRRSPRSNSAASRHER